MAHREFTTMRAPTKPCCPEDQRWDIRRFSEVGSSWLWIRVKCILCSGSHQTGSQSFSLLLLIWSSPLFTFSFSSQTVFTFFSQHRTGSHDKLSKKQTWCLDHCPSYPWCLVVSWMCQIIPWCVLSQDSWPTRREMLELHRWNIFHSIDTGLPLYHLLAKPVFKSYHTTYHDTIPWYHTIPQHGEECPQHKAHNVPSWSPPSFSKGRPKFSGMCSRLIP